MLARYLPYLLGLFLLPVSIAVGETARIRIGVSTALTGPVAEWGVDLQRVLRFANQKFGHDRYELIFEDDKCDNSSAVTVAHKLLDQDHVRAVFGLCSTTVVATSLLFERAKVPFFVPLTTSTSATRDRKYVFRATLNDQRAAAALSKHVAGHSKFVGILTESNEFSEGFRQDFSAAAKSTALRIENESFSPETTQFQALLLKFRKLGVDSLFINSNSERVFATISRQLKELQMNATIYGAYLPGTRVFRELVTGRTTPITFVDYPSAENILTDEGRILFQEFLADGGPLNISDYAFPAIIESFRSMDAALQAAEDPSKTLHGTSRTGIFGKYSFDENGDIQGPELAIKTIFPSGEIVTEPQATTTR